MNIPDKAVEAAARAIARAADADYWVDEIAEWEAQDEWEKEHYAEANYPSMAHEDRDDYMAQGRAALELAAPFIEAAVLHEQARTWGTTVDQYGRSIASHIHRDARIAEHGVGAT